MFICTCCLRVSCYEFFNKNDCITIFANKCYIAIGVLLVLEKLNEVDCIWILLIGKKRKKAKINPTNKKYTIIAALNHEEIKKDLQKITKIEPFTDKCNPEGIN